MALFFDLGKGGGINIGKNIEKKTKILVIYEATRNLISYYSNINNIEIKCLHPYFLLIIY